MITSVRLIHIGNNRNDYFRYFLGVRLIKVSLKVNKGNKFWDSAAVRLIEGVRLIQVSLYVDKLQHGYTKIVLSYIKCPTQLPRVGCGGWGGGRIVLIFAGYIPLASKSPYPIIVYSMANYRLHPSTFWAYI